MTFARNMTGALLSCAAAVTLAGCDNTAEDEVAVADVEPMEDEVVADTAFVLLPEQQERRDAVDMTAFETEIKGYVDEDRKTMGEDRRAMSADGSGGDAMAKGDMSQDKNRMSGDMTSRDMMMTFENLDRNDDGKLSVAEYAIYDLDTQWRKQGSKDDQNPPYFTSAQLNRAADGFFFYDKDGDTYLNQQEFTMAKSGASGSAM